MPLQQALVQAGLGALAAGPGDGFWQRWRTSSASFLPAERLWHPLTSVHIFGLLLATGLTLSIAAVIYYVFSAKLKLIK